MITIHKLCKSEAINLDEIKVIALDIFDTILYRKVSPMHVHRMWANEIIEYYGLSLTADEIVRLKFQSERIAKAKNIMCGKDKEYSYGQMTNILRKKLKLSVADEEFYSKAVELELKVEKEVTYIIDDIRDMLNSIPVGKRVICISDFYLPENAMTQLLAYHGIGVSKIYVSSEYQLLKKTGRLFSRVLEEEGFNPQQVLMIGDTYDSDYVEAKKTGLKAIYLQNEFQQKKSEAFEENLKRNRIAYKDFMKSDEMINRKIPFSNVAFLMYIFTNRLYKALLKDGCHDVLFMSREGEFFKKLFDCYQEKFVEPSKRVITHYFYVSRRATIVPSIFDISPESFKEIYKNYPEMSLNAFLKNLGLDKDEDIIRALHNYDFDTPIRDFPSSKEFRALLECKIFQTRCLQEADAQRKLFIKYINDMDVRYMKDGLYLVDVGYSGTSQNNIFKIFGEEVRIRGYYMISYAEKSSINELCQKKGILHDGLRTDRKDIFTYNSAVIEMLALASHCGVEAYQLSDNSVEPVFHYNEQEMICYKNVISEIQSSIIDEFARIGKFVKDAYLDENYYYAAFRKSYKRFICNPTEVEMKKYLTIPFVDNFAIYREYTPDKMLSTHRYISLKGVKDIVCTKGQCLKDQNTHWMAAAFYKLDMRCINPMIYCFSDIAMFMFDFMVNLNRKKKGIKTS